MPIHVGNAGSGTKDLIIEQKNYVTNGFFETNTSGWSAGGNLTLSRLSINDLTSNTEKRHFKHNRAKLVTTSNDNIYQVVNLVQNKYYFLSYKHYKGYTNAYVGPNASSGSAIATTGDVYGDIREGVYKSAFFQATSGTLYISVYGIGNRTSEVGEISITELDGHNASATPISGSFPDFPTIAQYNWANARQLDGNFYFKRSSVGTYVGANGLIQTAGKDEPRFHHDPETLEPLGLLIEESRINHVVNNQDASASGLTVMNGTATKSGYGPDGVENSAILYTTNTSSGYHGLMYSISGLENSTSQRGVYSVFVKANSSSNYRRVIIYDNAQSGGQAYGVIDLIDREVDYMANSNQVMVEKYPNDWIRIQANFQRPDTPTSSSFFIIFDSTTSGNGTTSFTGDGSSSFYIWGAQMEAASNANHNKSVASMPIATSGSAVTTGRDNPWIYKKEFEEIYHHAFGKGGTMVNQIQKRKFRISGDGMQMGGMGSPSFRDAITANIYNDTGGVYYGNYNAVNAYFQVDPGKTLVTSAGSFNGRAAGMNDYDHQVQACCSGSGTFQTNNDPGSSSSYRTLVDRTDHNSFAFGGHIPWESPTGTYPTIGVQAMNYFSLYKLPLPANMLHSVSHNK